MKLHLLLLTLVGLVIIPVVGQPSDPTGSDPTVAALTGLLPLKSQAKFGEFLKANKEQAKFGDFLKDSEVQSEVGKFLKASHTQSHFAQFLDNQGKFALLANREALLQIKMASDKPNYAGNAAAATRNNLWKAVLEGKVSSVVRPSGAGE